MSKNIPTKLLSLIRSIKGDAGLQPILQQNYGIEIILILISASEKKQEVGISQLYEMLSSPKPTFSTVRNFTHSLTSRDIICIKTSTEKASKKSLVIQKNALKRLLHHLDSFAK